MRTGLEFLLALLCIAVVVRRDTDHEPTAYSIGLLVALVVVVVLLLVTEP